MVAAAPIAYLDVATAPGAARASRIALMMSRARIEGEVPMVPGQTLLALEGRVLYARRLYFAAIGARRLIRGRLTWFKVRRRLS